VVSRYSQYQGKQVGQNGCKKPQKPTTLHSILREKTTQKAVAKGVARDQTFYHLSQIVNYFLK